MKYINIIKRDYKNIIHPYNYSNYKFKTNNSVNFSDGDIQYAEQILERAKNQMIINNLINNIDIAIKIELSIFEFSLIYCLNNNCNIRFIKAIYDDKLSNILLNLNPKNHLKNTTFLKNIFDGIIDPSNVGFLTPVQLNPENWQHLIKKKEYKEWRASNISYSTAYKCYKCGESKCKVTQAQTRSADEPITTFIVCTICKNTFKFG